MDIIKLMLLSRQMKNRRHEKNNTVTGIPPLTFTANKKGLLKNYRIYGNTETLTRSYSGTAPLSFPIVDGGVSNYRIYGNTVNGVSVGDKTENLFDMKKFAETCYPRYASVTFVNNTLSFTTTANDAYVNIVYGEGTTVDEEYRPSCVDVLPSTTYTISMSSAPKCYISWVDDSFTVVSAYTRIPQNQSSYTFTTPSNCTKLLIRLGKEVANIGDTFTISDIMLNSGSTALPYEPYGYRIPITNNSETANIYLDEPLTKSGNNADYIDYAEQKRHNADGTSEDVTLPALPAQSSTNSLSVGTSVQPSSVAVDVAEVVSCGDKTENLFDGEFLQGYWSYANGTRNNDSSTWITTPKILCKPNTNYTFTVSYIGRYFGFVWFGSNGVYISSSYVSNTTQNQAVNFSGLSPVDASYFAINIKARYDVSTEAYTNISPSDVTDFMLVENSTALPYEPYGYKIPVTNNSETANIYLDEPLAKSGNGADYIDYAAQKRRNSDGTESSVTLPEIAVTAGTNTFTIGTEVQPSRVELTGRIKEAQTNGSGNT